MSMILTMTAAAIIAGLSLSEVSLAALVANECSTETDDEGLETIFTDVEILKKTILEMDCHMDVVSENEVHVMTTCGRLAYKRQSSEEAFRLFLGQVSDREGLIENIRSFEVDYGRNVQDYTFAHIRENLGEGMRIIEEGYENDDLYITISVE